MAIDWNYLQECVRKHKMAVYEESKKKHEEERARWAAMTEEQKEREMKLEEVKAKCFIASKNELENGVVVTGPEYRG